MMVRAVGTRAVRANSVGVEMRLMSLTIIIAGRTSIAAMGIRMMGRTSSAMMRRYCRTKRKA